MKTSYSYNLSDGWGEVEVEIAPLGKFVPLHEFRAGWAMLFSRELRHYDTYLPTQMVVRKPELVQPQRGRVFGTGLYVYEGAVVDYNGLRACCEKRRPRRKFEGTGSYEEVVLVEVYADHGDEGHTNYCLAGYRFVGENALEMRDEWRGTMMAMVTQAGDYP